MKILQTVKYYEPSKGGMESVVKDIAEGVSDCSNIEFTIYANNHFRSFKRQDNLSGKNTIIKERTPFLYKSQPLNFFYPELRKLIKSNDIIHHHYPFPTMELALLKNKKLLHSKKLVITWHANIKNSRWSWIKKFYDPMIKKLLSLAHTIVVTSPQLFENAEILQEYKEKVVVIPLSYNPSIASGALYKNYPNARQFKLLFVGKLREYKGLIYLIDAIKDLDVELSIVGDGEKEVELKNRVEELGLSNRVFFKKGLSNEDLAGVYKESDIFILPSINEAEAFGVVQLEAMANGLPVINTSLKSGVPFVSLKGETGETVRPCESIELAVAINKICSDPILYETYSKNALERAKMFTTKNMALKYLNVYQNL